jgi:hypothetical protein
MLFFSKLFGAAVAENRRSGRRVNLSNALASRVNFSRLAQGRVGRTSIHNALPWIRASATFPQAISTTQAKIWDNTPMVPTACRWRMPFQHLGLVIVVGLFASDLFCIPFAKPRVFHGARIC